MRDDPERDIIFDTGPLMEILSGSPFGISLNERIKSGKINPLTGQLNIGELRYLICRKMGWKGSLERVSSLLETGFFRILPIAEFLEKAAQLKCARSLSFIDCLTISIGESMKRPVLFAFQEKELEKEMKKKPFASKIIFLKDLL